MSVIPARGPRANKIKSSSYRGKNSPGVNRRWAMKEAYKTAFEIAQIMDYGMMDSFLKDLKSYKLPSEDKEKIARIEQMLTELNWDGIIKIVR